MKPSKKQPSPDITLGTLNVQNIKGNSIYVSSILKTIDILAIQEHWLFNFEQDKLSEYFPHHNYTVKSNDDDDPISPLERKRGLGGVAILWKKTLDHSIEKLSDGSNRILAVSLSTESGKICIISVYMPCKGKKDSSLLQQSTLDEVAEIISKYSPTHKIILLGDFNAQLLNNASRNWEKAILHLLHESRISLNSDYPVKPTFFHHNERDKAQIDFIATDLPGARIKIYDQTPLNTSDHILVSASFSGIRTTKMNAAKAPDFIPTKPKWYRCDHTLYQDTINTLLQTNSCHTTKVDKTQILLDTVHLENVVKEAAHRSIPGHNKTKTTKGKGIWSPTIQLASQDSKKAFWEWKEAGRPKQKDDVTFTTMKEKKRDLRRAQRKHEADKRDALYTAVMESHENDKQTFFKLINKQRKTGRSNTDVLKTNNGLASTHNDILNTWTEHFSKLATPKTLEHYDHHFKELVDLETLCIQEVLNSSDITINTVKPHRVASIIKGLSNNKAADVHGITAEHLKYGGNHMITYITNLINKILKTRHLPPTFKEGILTPVPKKGKDLKDPNNYRGITVTPVLGKILEVIILDQVKLNTKHQINPLQRGFTEGTSPNHAALIVTECINEALDKKVPLALATLDAEKAFDVVWHNGLFRKLHHMNLHPDIWALLRDLQVAAPTKVKWNNDAGLSFTPLQGIRQGAKASPELYKCYNNGLLDALTNSRIGMKIGSVFVGAPTVADDVALIADSPTDLAAALQIVHGINSKDRVNINSRKSEIVLYNCPRKTHSSWELGNNEIHETNKTTHLGILRDTSLKHNIEDRIMTGRKTLYSLLGAGLHGRNGVNPAITIQMYKVYARPRIIYGLETVHLSQKETRLLESYEAKVVRQLQYLPDRCATAAAYVMLGLTPILSTIEINALTLFGNIIREKNSIEHSLAKRQLALKDSTSHSWFTGIRRILLKYDLPSAFDLIQDPPNKSTWKSVVSDAVNLYWFVQWSNEKASKPSMRFLTIPDKPLNRPHHLWASLGTNPAQVKEAMVKVRLLTGTYTLQANRARFNQHSVVDTCPLCKTGAENREHFLLHCPSLLPVRQTYIPRLVRVMSINSDNKAGDAFIKDDLLRLQCILDCSDKEVAELLDANQEVIHSIENISRSLVYDLHRRRNSLICSTIK